MKIIVDQMPASKADCPYSVWSPNPPFIEEPGRYECRFSAKDDIRKIKCDLCESTCHHLRQIEQ